MKTTMTALLSLSMIAASAFASQEAPKTVTDSKATTAKVKKHKKAVKATTPAAVKPVATAKPVAAVKPAATPSK